MERTRHFTATVYLVNDGAVALHEHPGLGTRVPPGGHVDRDELPHETALREVREETGLDATLVAQREAHLDAPSVRSLPKPEHVHLADVNVHDGTVGHQHVDLVYYAAADAQRIEPDPGEQPAEDWAWFDPETLAERSDLESNVRKIATRAVETVGEWREGD